MIQALMGGIPGGLGIGTIIICALVAAMADVSGAATVSLGVIALPAMLKRDDKRPVTGTIMAGGALGFAPIWFAILFIVSMQTAYITPFGYNLSCMRAVAPPEINVNDLCHATIPFIFLQIFGLALFVVFPGFALWLPGLLFAPRPDHPA